MSLKDFNPDCLISFSSYKYKVDSNNYTDISEKSVGTFTIYLGLFHWNIIILKSNYGKSSEFN